MFCGAGGSRTLVQTRNPQAFYMLMLLLFFVQGKETAILNLVLSSVFNPVVEAPPERSQI